MPDFDPAAIQVLAFEISGTTVDWRSGVAVLGVLRKRRIAAVGAWLGVAGFFWLMLFASHQHWHSLYFDDASAEVLAAFYFGIPLLVLLALGGLPRRFETDLRISLAINGTGRRRSGRGRTVPLSRPTREGRSQETDRFSICPSRANLAG